MKATGIKLNRVSALELAAGIICLLILLPFAKGAYNNFRTRSAYYEGVGYYLGRDFMNARKELETCVDSRPETYFPHELLAMCYYHQGDIAKAQSKFEEIRADPVLNSHERAVLGDLAVNSLKLLAQKNEDDGETSDSIYAELSKRAEKLSAKKGYIEAQLVKAQLSLDSMVVAKDQKTRQSRESTLDLVISRAREMEKKAAKSPASARGMAVLYNTLGVANFERGLMIWDQVSVADRAKTTPTKKMQEASEYTASAVRYFTKAIQYKTFWATPYINFERAMGRKLVEPGLSEEERRAWLERALAYRAMRTERIALIRVMGLNADKELPLDKKKNLYVLFVGMGWAYAILGEWNLSQDYLGQAFRLDRKAAVADVGKARSAARYWKRYAELAIASKDHRTQSLLQADTAYKKALQQAGNNPIRRLRLLNNQALFLVLSRAGNVLMGADQIGSAVSLVKVLENNQYSSRVARERLGEKTRANGVAIANYLLKLKRWPKEQRARLQSLKAKCQ